MNKRSVGSLELSLWMNKRSAGSLELSLWMNKRSAGFVESCEVGLVEDDGVWRGLVHVKVDLVIVEEASLRSRRRSRRSSRCGVSVR
jgi:hypothetical protein